MSDVRNDLGEILLLSTAAGFGLLLNSWTQTGLDGRAYESFDAALMPFIGGGATFGALMLGGHLALRWGEVRSALAYAAMGALASFCAFLAWGGRATLERASEQGTVTLAIGLPVLIGLALGSIYYRVAGREPPEDPSRRYAELNRLAGEQPGAPLIEAEGSQFYSGPLQVRTSLPLLFASGAALGAVFCGLILLLGLSSTLVQRMVNEYPEIIPYGGQYALAGTMITTICSSLFLFPSNLLAHKVANHFRITGSGGYAATAFGVNFAAGLLIFPLIFLALPSALSMLIYRRWAGLEPVPLPGHIWVKDRNALVAEDSPLRRYREIVTD